MTIEDVFKEDRDDKPKDYTVIKFVRRSKEFSVPEDLTVILDYGYIKKRNFRDFVSLVKDSLIENGCEVSLYDVDRVYPYIAGKSEKFDFTVRIWGGFWQSIIREVDALKRVYLKLYAWNDTYDSSQKGLENICRGVMVTVPEWYREKKKEGKEGYKY